MSPSSTPEAAIRTGGSNSPSWKISVALAEVLPGLVPPISALWAIEAAKPTSALPTMMGDTKAMSETCGSPPS